MIAVYKTPSSKLNYLQTRKPTSIQQVLCLVNIACLILCSALCNKNTRSLCVSSVINAHMAKCAVHKKMWQLLKVYRNIIL